MDVQNSNRIGRPRSEVDMALVAALLPSLSIRQIAKQVGVHHNTLSYRLRSDRFSTARPTKRLFPEPRLKPNPFCVTDRVCMYSEAGGRYFRCRKCRGNTLPPKPPKVVNHRRGRPPKKFDHLAVSELLTKHPVIDVAEKLGVHRNTIYRYIGLGVIAPRPIRTWTPRGASRVGFALYWPYMESNDPRYAGVIRSVNEAVPRSLVDEVRADVCQEILLSVLSGELSESDIGQVIQHHIRRHYKLFPVRDYKTVSLDAPVRGTDRPLIDTLDAEDIAERLSDAWAANRLTEPKRGSYPQFEQGAKRNAPRVRVAEYDYLRRKYQLVNGRIRVSGHTQAERFGGAWSIETALSEELRPAMSFDQQP